MAAKWTFIYLLHAGDKVMKTAADSLIADLIKSPLAENSNILIVYSTKQTIPGEDAHGDTNDVRTILWQVKKNGQFNDLIFINNFGEINIGNYKILSTIFSYIDTKYDPTKISLTLWDHGSGFGVFGEDPDKFSKFLELDLPYYETNPVTKFFKGLFGFTYSSYVYKIARKINIDALTANELQDAIHNGFSGKKITMLTISSCFMQIFDNGYALKDDVEYLFAPQSTDFIIGYDFISFNQLLVQFNPNKLTAKQFAENFINTIPGFFKKKMFSEYLKELSVSFLDLSESDNLKVLLDSVAESIKNKYAANKQTIKKIIANQLDFSTFWGGYTQDYGVRNYFDLLKLCNNLCQQEIIQTELLEKIKDSVDSYVLKTFTGDKIKKHSGDCCGVSVFNPFRNSDFLAEGYFDTYYSDKSKTQTLFAKKSKWKEYLKLYDSN